MASCCATVLLWMSKCCQTSSPGNQSGMEQTQRGVRFFHGDFFVGAHQLSASKVEIVVDPLTNACAQLTVGSLASRNGKPKI